MTNTLLSGVFITTTSHADSVVHEGGQPQEDTSGTNHDCWHSSSMTDEITTLHSDAQHNQGEYCL